MDDAGPGRLDAVPKGNDGARRGRAPTEHHRAVVVLSLRPTGPPHATPPVESIPTSRR